MSLELDGTQVVDRLRGPQVRLLTAYLLLNRARPVGRDELVEALWSGRRPRSEDAALRTLLSRLRSVLGGTALSRGGEVSLTLPEPVWVDVEAAGVELARAQQALQQGDPHAAWALAQVPLNIASRGLLPGATAGWLEASRRELEDVRLRALEVIGASGLRIGGAQLGSAERAARSLIEAEPYRESGYVLLMDALALRGNVAEGLRVFERLRVLLRDELGTTPSPDTLAAHDRLLHPHAGRGRGRLGSTVTGPVALPAELLQRARQPLVGRLRELEELGRVWGAARAGRLHGLHPAAGGPGPLGGLDDPRRVVVLSGAAGIGKTSLVAELARRAHEEGAVVLAGHAQEEGLAPYQPFLEALSHFFSAVSVDELGAEVGEYGPELAPLIPELRLRAPELAPRAQAESETKRYRLFEAFVGLLTAIAARAPVLLVLDDLHWADRPTLLLLRHLARAREPSRLLIAVAYRSDAAAPALLDLLADLRRERLLIALEVGGLSEPETGELVRRRTGETPSRALVRALHAQTEGNPFFVEEIARSLAAAGVSVGAATASELERFALPEGVREILARRLSQLEPRTVEMLRVAAVAGREFDAGLLERLVGLGEEEFLGALEQALAAGILLEAGREAGASRYSFAHALIREVLYEGMSAPRRARLHRRVGRELELEGRAAVSVLALHFTRAATGPGEVQKAVAYARRAGRDATAVLAYEEATRHYARALEVLRGLAPAGLRGLAPAATGELLELLLELGESQVRAGERARAQATFREAAALARRAGDRAAFVRAAIGAARQYVQQPGVVEREVIELLEQALELTGGEATVERVRLLACLCGALYFSPQRERMEKLSEEAGRIAAQLSDPLAQAHARAARRRALWKPALLEERLLASTEMLTLARAAGDTELQLQAHAWLVVDLLESDEPEGVDAQVAAFAAAAERLRQPLYLWQAAVWRAMRALLDGRLERAETLAQEALALGRPGEEVTAPEYFAVQLLTIRREQGRMGELEPLVRAAAGRDPPRPAWRAALATVLAEAGKLAEARAELERLAVDGLAAIPEDGDWLVTIALLGELCAEQLDARGAEAMDARGARALDARGAEAMDAQLARALYARLLPYSGRQVVVGFAAVCLGPVDRVLGRLAAVCGDRDRGLAHFDAALAAAERLRSPLWQAHAQLDYAQALGGGLRASRLARDAAVTAERLGLARVARRAARLCPGRGTLPSANSCPRRS